MLNDYFRSSNFFMLVASAPRGGGNVGLAGGPAYHPEGAPSKPGLLGWGRS
jgi:hypothetical protein